MGIWTKISASLIVFTPQAKTANPKFALTDKEKDLNGKTIVFTGGTDGIGRVTVEMLTDMGAEVIILSRSEAKGQKVVDELNSKNKGKAVLVQCDLSSLDNVKKCAENILSKYTKINMLVNCAGINMLGVVKLSTDNIENTWAINYFAPVLLTRLLQPIITERVVNLTTDTRFIDTIDYDYIESCKDFNSKSPYFDSKLSLNMFSIDLAKELKDSGVTVNTMLPGYIKSSLLRDLKGAAKIMQTLMNVMASPTEVGADRIVRLVAAEKFGTESGLYMHEDKILPFHPEAQKIEKRKAINKLTNNVLSKWL